MDTTNHFKLSAIGVSRANILKTDIFKAMIRRLSLLFLILLMWFLLLLLLFIFGLIVVNVAGVFVWWYEMSFSLEVLWLSWGSDDFNQVIPNCSYFSLPLATCYSTFNIYPRRTESQSWHLQKSGFADPCLLLATCYLLLSSCF